MEASYDRLRAAVPSEVLEDGAACVERLRAALGADAPVPDRTVLVGYGGGKDSSYTVAFVRLVQLLHEQRYGDTFTVRTVTNRQPGMPQAVLDNVDRCYRALGMLDDPRCELLVADAGELYPFQRERPPSRRLIDRYTMDLLMTGHRTAGEARPTFCNSCNLEMLNAFGLAAAAGGGVDMVITGDSTREQRLYYVWIHRLARQFGIDSTRGTGFDGFLGTTGELARRYYTEIHGPGADAARDRVATIRPHPVTFFSIYDFTQYSSKAHWSLLTDFLGFEFDDIAFSFSESDCGNPALMAHLRGLKVERCYGRSYAEGIEEYLKFGLDLMRRKDMPQELIAVVRRRYAGEAGVRTMRTAVRCYAEATYRLTDEQLICMVYAPFVGRGAGLDAYLRREQVHLVDQLPAAHRLLADDAPDGGELAGALEAASGLSLDRLRLLYQTAPPVAPVTSMLNAILRHDPHQRLIWSRHAPDGPWVQETISGR